MGVRSSVKDGVERMQEGRAEEGRRGGAKGETLYTVGEGGGRGRSGGKHQIRRIRDRQTDV